MYCLFPVLFLAQILSDFVLPGNGHQFGFKVLTENSCFGIALNARQCAPAQRSVDVDMSVGEQFCSGTDGCHDDQVATACIYLLT